MPDFALINRNVDEVFKSRVMLIPKKDFNEKTDFLIEARNGYESWKDCRALLNTRGVRYLRGYGWYIAKSTRLFSFEETGL